EHVALRRAQWADDAVRARAHVLYAKLGSPPGRLLRFVGRAFHPLYLFVVWWPGMFLITLLVVLLVVLPLGGVLSNANLGDVLTNPDRTRLCVWPAALLLIVLTACGVYGRRRALSRKRLQAALSARPSAAPGGPAICRACGAALEVLPHSLGSRC